MKASITISLLDGNLLMLQSLAALLRTQKNLHILFHAQDAAQMLDHLRHRVPDILIIGVRRNQPKVHMLLRELKSYTQIKLIALTEDLSNTELSNLLVHHGVKAALAKSTTAQTLMKAIKEVQSGGYYYSPEISKLLPRR